MNAFNDFKSKLKEAILSTNITCKNNSLNTGNLSQFIDNIYKNKDRLMISEEGFSAYVNFQEFLEFVRKPECDARCLDEIRGLFLSLYSGIANIADFCSKDIEPIRAIKNGIIEFQKQSHLGGKAKELQLRWFSQNLENILLRLGEGGDEHE